MTDKKIQIEDYLGNKLYPKTLIDLIINNGETLNVTLEKILFYPIIENETGVINQKYTYGDVRRYSEPQNAIDSVNMLLIPKNYSLKITKPLLVKPNTTIEGYSQESQIYCDTDIVMLMSNHSGRCDNVKITNLTFYKNCISSKETLNLTRISHSYFNNLYIRKTGTSNVGCIGIKSNEYTNGESLTYYNYFSKVKIDGFNIGIDFRNASNGNNFSSCTVINCQDGMVLDKTNSCTFNGCNFEMIGNRCIILQNKSTYNFFGGIRLEGAPYSFQIKYQSDGSGAYNNYIFGVIDYTTNGYDVSTSNFIIDKNTRILKNSDWSEINSKIDEIKTSINTYCSTSFSLSSGVEKILPCDKTNSNNLEEYNVSNYTFTPKKDSTYLINCNFDFQGEINIYNGSSKIRTISPSGSCSVFLNANSTITFKALPSESKTVPYNFSKNRIDINNLK